MSYERGLVVGLALVSAGIYLWIAFVRPRSNHDRWQFVLGLVMLSTAQHFYRSDGLPVGPIGGMCVAAIIALAFRDPDSSAPAEGDERTGHGSQLRQEGHGGPKQPASPGGPDGG